jgi:hypothetical protein
LVTAFALGTPKRIQGLRDATGQMAPNNL